MTVRFSQDYNLNIDVNACKRCNACGLYLNQAPALDYCTTADIFWVGLSAVQFGEADDRMPLSPTTRSGGLIELAEQALADEFTFYRTNIVKCLPLNSGKIRYPLEHEMDKCFPNFQEELQNLHPSFVFLLGKQVATFVLKKLGIKNYTLAEDFNFTPIYAGGICFVPVHHPSYILVYKRKFVAEYIAGIRQIVLAASPRPGYLSLNDPTKKIGISTAMPASSLI